MLFIGMRHPHSPRREAGTRQLTVAEWLWVGSRQPAVPLFDEKKNKQRELSLNAAQPPAIPRETVLVEIGHAVWVVVEAQDLELRRGGELGMRGLDSGSDVGVAKVGRAILPDSLSCQLRLEVHCQLP
jgi:hypothetical protein